MNSNYLRPGINSSIVGVRDYDKLALILDVTIDWRRLLADAPRNDHIDRSLISFASLKSGTIESPMERTFSHVVSSLSCALSKHCQLDMPLNTPLVDAL
jgi:hypothetical protein